MRMNICLEIAKEMDRYEIDGYWYGRHESVISKVTCKKRSDDSIQDLANEIYRVAMNDQGIYEKVWNEEYSAYMWDENKRTGRTYDWTYRNAIKNWIKEQRQSKPARRWSMGIAHTDETDKGESMSLVITEGQRVVQEMLHSGYPKDQAIDEVAAHLNVTYGEDEDDIKIELWSLIYK